MEAAAAVKSVITVNGVTTTGNMEDPYRGPPSGGGPS